MVPVNLVANGPSIPICAGTETEALLHDATRKCVQLRHAAGARDAALADAPGSFDRQGHAHSASNARAAKFGRIIRHLNLARDVLKIGSAFICAVAIPPGSASRS